MQGVKEFEELSLYGTNYPDWASNIKIGFASRGILSTIDPPVENGAAITDIMKYTALLLLRTSIHKDLKREYLLEENPKNLWLALKEHYEQQKEIIYPDAQYEWNHLRQQDFKSAEDYNHAIHNICTRLKFCEKEPSDAEKIQKTLATMHPADKVLCNQYRKEQHQHDKLQLKNHHLRPVGSTPLPEVHNVQNNVGNKRKSNGPSQDYQKNSTGRNGRNFTKNRRYKVNKRARGNAQPPRRKARICHKCGCNTHFAAACRTPKHLVDLYLKSIRDSKQKDSKFEAHFNQSTAPIDHASSSKVLT
ncbi:hypothetical protein BS78_K245400 [Paspalum vaginatum]|uniref:CCHC-type domain-containing protein n=1 Tax=Paspalum vaginatum TaxID=158149 RepID=A0A9W7XBA3_9POAL|nr:hypothetical protein BS78_K245400 [Paspalum vaginatum]